MTRTPLRGSEYVFDEPPRWLPGPLRTVAMDLTYDEAHAAELGLLGLPLGAGLALGYASAVVPVLVALVGLVFGLKKAPDNLPVAGRIVKNESWYFTTVLVLMVTIGAAAGSLLLYLGN